MPNTITKLDTLTECETVIEHGLDTFVDVGRALMTIRDERLYRESHKTFASYCQERWGFSYRRAAQLIEACGVNENVNHGSQKPNERQARELAKAPADQQAAIWDAVVDEYGDGVTAAKVREAVSGTKPHVTHNSAETSGTRSPEQATKFTFRT